jgi:subtilisin family serine protease
VAQAILAAVDAEAQIINISLGGYESSPTLNRAIDYAAQRGVVIVASAGNDQAAQLTWPAADARVVSVGALDALGQQVIFSNSSPQLQMTAPGYGVQTAWLDEQRVYFDGTSASAPIVAGAIAAMMSANPGLSAAQAWQTLRQYASDGGAPEPDPDYGNGILNVGWAMNRNDPLRIDTAISSHYYDAATGQMEFVVQNRSGQGVSGMVLNVEASGTTTTYSIPLLGPGATYVVKMAVDQSQLKANPGIVFRTQLANPGGVIDQVPANNRKTSALAPPTQ